MVTASCGWWAVPELAEDLQLRHMLLGVEAPAEVEPVSCQRLAASRHRSMPDGRRLRGALAVKTRRRRTATLSEPVQRPATALRPEERNDRHR